MQKAKRILALLGIVILVGMYVITFILGLTASPATKNMLMASIACTIVLPCLLYGMMVMSRVLGGKKDEENKKKRD